MYASLSALYFFFSTRLACWSQAHIVPGAQTVRNVHSQSCLKCVCIVRGVEKALDQSLTPPVQAEVADEAAPAGGEEANGPTAEEIAEAEAKVLTFNLQITQQC